MKLSKQDISLIESILDSGGDAVIRKYRDGIAVFEQSMTLRKRKDFPKEENKMMSRG